MRAKGGGELRLQLYSRNLPSAHCLLVWLLAAGCTFVAKAWSKELDLMQGSLYPSHTTPSRCTAQTYCSSSSGSFTTALYASLQASSLSPPLPAAQQTIKISNI